MENNKISIDLQIYKEESSYFAALYDMSVNGEISLKIKTPYLEKALEFCTKRPDYPIKDDFDRRFLDDVRESGLDLIDLILAAGKLGINNLVNLLFEDVYRIVCNEKTAEQLEKIFKVRYNDGTNCFFWIDGLLNCLPPCPTLSEKEQEETETEYRREFIVTESPDGIKYLSESQRRYWVYAHLAFQCNPSLFIELNQLSEEDAAAIKKEEEEDAPIIVVMNSFSSPIRLMELKMETSIDRYGLTYINLHGKTSMFGENVLKNINELYAMESEYIWDCRSSFDGEIHFKFESPFLEKALEFCVRRALFRRNYRFMSSSFLFDGKLLEDLMKSGLDPVHLVHTAGKLGIHSLFNLLFEEVFDIVCNKKTPEELEKIFKVRYNDVTCRLINKALDLVPPCPKLSKVEQDEMKREREDILKTYAFKTLSDSKRRYWVYAHLVANYCLDEEEQEQEESKIPKTIDDVGGPGPRGQAWKKWTTG